MRTLIETSAVHGELLIDRPPALVGIALRRVDDVEQQPRAFEMREEFVAQPYSFARALDQAGNVCDRELPPVR